MRTLIWLLFDRPRRGTFKTKAGLEDARAVAFDIAILLTIGAVIGGVVTGLIWWACT